MSPPWKRPFRVGKTRSFAPISLIPVILAFAIASAAEKDNSWTYLDNGIIRIGVDRSRGAAVGHLALTKDKRNLLNHHDEGRFIQQSYYGDADGSMWGEKPWSYNPVQGGSYKGEDPKTLEFRSTEKELHAKVEPLHWASARRCPEAIMQEWITLGGPIARIRMRIDYTGDSQTCQAHQKMPELTSQLHTQLERWLKENVAPRYMPQRDETVSPEAATGTFPFRDLR